MISRKAVAGNLFQRWHRRCGCAVAAGNRLNQDMILGPAPDAQDMGNLSNGNDECRQFRADGRSAGDWIG